MALRKSKELENGVVGEYWKIIGIMIDYLTGNVRINVGLYIDAKAKNAGKRVVQMREYRYVSTLTIKEKGKANDPRDDGYDYLKTLKDFEGAEDV